MKVDVHITTCHRSDVKCRPRPSPNDGRPWNVKEWTPEERLQISKLSIDSVQRFVNTMRYYHDVELTILDDGSDNKEANEWLDALSLLHSLNVKRFPARGSSAGINDHISSLKLKPDYIIHIEDDHILFNPKSLDIIGLIDNGPEGVYTLRSGLPFEKTDRGFSGFWGPIGTVKKNLQYIQYRSMGNAHHIVRYDMYKRFLPLQGNTGGCESYMNSVLQSLNIPNYEPQIHVHAFHSHTYKYPIESINLKDWHKSGEGYEYGIKDMHEHLISKKPIISQIWDTFPNKYFKLELDKYDY